MATHRLTHAGLYLVGLAALALAAARHRLLGYRTPTSFPASDWPRSVEHVRGIVEDWRASLVRAGRPTGFRNQRVLELGPGATLGTGILAIGLGARSYHAIDIFPLAAETPCGFYRALMASDLAPDFDRARMEAALEGLGSGASGLARYTVDPGFDIVGAAAGQRFDLIVSNAAFEHFDDIGRIVEQAGRVAAPGALFLAMVDFQTHSRWVREVDPNSIYRYGDALYGLLAFPGQPNRQRPDDYVRFLTRSGWADPVVHPVDRIDPTHVSALGHGLHTRFRAPERKMDILTGIVTAHRASQTIDPVTAAQGHAQDKPV